MPPTNRKKIAIGIVLAAIFLFALLSIPVPDPRLPEGIAGKPFTWKQDETWNALEASFRQGRSIGCDGLKEPVDRGLSQGVRYLRALAALRFGPDAKIFAELGKTTFSLAAMVATCPARLRDYIDLATKTRSLLA